MRYLNCLFVAALCNAAYGQDPTVPSAQILERLGGEQVSAVALPASQERQTPPVLKLKAMVMTDSDHGTALIEVEGRRIRLRLSRSEVGLDPVVIQGSIYRLKSFSAHSVMLESNGQLLIGQ